MPNTIADNLQRLITAKTDIKNAIIQMGGGVGGNYITPLNGGVYNAEYNC